jgi:hypothetical protein
MTMEKRVTTHVPLYAYWSHWIQEIDRSHITAKTSPPIYYEVRYCWRPRQRSHATTYQIEDRSIEEETGRAPTRERERETREGNTTEEEDLN